MTYRAIFDGANRISRWYEIFGDNGLVQRYIENGTRLSSKVSDQVNIDRMARAFSFLKH